MIDMARFLNRQKAKTINHDENVAVVDRKKTGNTTNFRNALVDVGNKITSNSSNNLKSIQKKDECDKKLLNNKYDDKFVQPSQCKTQQTATEVIENEQMGKCKVKYEFKLLSNEICKMEISDCDADGNNDVHMKSTHITDIDEDDHDNPLLVSEYVQDIYGYLNELERKHRVANKFLENKKVTSKMRAVLIDWLTQVHLKFHLLQETLFLCVHIIDLYLQVQDVVKEQLQLVGVTAMFLASKYEEMYVPTIEDFVYMTDNTYTKADIRRMEVKILQTLNYMLGKPLALNFLRRFSKAGQADPKQHTLAKYLMELSLHDSEFSSFDPSYLAACSLALSFRLLDGPNWNETLVYYTTYKYDSLLNGIKKLCKLVLKATETDYKYKAVTAKYGSSKFLRISLLPQLQGSIVKEFANMDVK